MVSDEREEKIISNIGLVHSIAKRFVNRGAEYEDIFQAGCVGLIKAVDNFDNTKGFKFSTYAVPVIMGEIKRIFRDGGSIKISRSLKEKSIYINKIRNSFLKSELREPTVTELAEACNLSSEEICEIIGVITPPVSLSYENEDELLELDIPIDNSDELFNRIYISSILNYLNGDERKLIFLRYFEGKTQSETAKYLNISQVQVSRREKAIINKLRNRFND